MFHDLKVTTLKKALKSSSKFSAATLPTADPKMEFALVNSVAGIMVGGKAKNFEEGMEIARESIDSGSAYRKLKDLIKVSGGSLRILEELEAKYE